jgi:hypothetical protein
LLYTALAAPEARLEAFSLNAFAAAKLACAWRKRPNAVWISVELRKRPWESAAATASVKGVFMSDFLPIILFDEIACSNLFSYLKLIKKIDESLC